MRRVQVLGFMVALALAGCGSSHTVGHTTSAPVTGKTSALVNGCRHVAVPAPKGPQHLRPPTLRLDPARTYTINVTTNCGAFAFDLDVRQSPKTSASIYALVKHGFYDGLTFQRVAADFVIQGGDPLGNGTGGPGYTVVEPPPASTQYVEGTVAMAKTETQPSGASGSQFFIVTTANATASAGLTPVYALAGKVVSGLGVVEAIGRLPTNPAQDGYPDPPVVMSKVTVTVS